MQHMSCCHRLIPDASSLVPVHMSSRSQWHSSRLGLHTRVLDTGTRGVQASSVGKRRWQSGGTPPAKFPPSSPMPIGEDPDGFGSLKRFAGDTSSGQGWPVKSEAGVVGGGGGGGGGGPAAARLFQPGTSQAAAMPQLAPPWHSVTPAAEWQAASAYSSGAEASVQLSPSAARNMDRSAGQPGGLGSRGGGSHRGDYPVMPPGPVPVAQPPLPLQLQAQPVAVAQAAAAQQQSPEAVTKHLETLRAATSAAEKALADAQVTVNQSRSE